MDGFSESRLESRLDVESGTDRPVRLDQHDSVRSHVCQRLSGEVAQLERRIEILRTTNAPHAAIIIASYERMIDRKRGFMQNWDLSAG